MTIHVVRAGETLNTIAGRYGVDAAWLAACNAVPSDGTLATGQTLLVRFPRRTDRVRGGDTLTAIASRNGIRMKGA